MKQITSIINYPSQIQELILPDGTPLTLEFYFCPMQFGWFFRSITYGTFILNNVRIVNSPNILHQYRNQIPFGIACFSTNDREPSLQQDFSSNASILYLLNKTETKEYEDFLTGVQ